MKTLTLTPNQIKFLKDTLAAYIQDDGHSLEETRELLAFYDLVNQA